MKKTNYTVATLIVTTLISSAIEKRLKVFTQK